MGNKFCKKKMDAVDNPKKSSTPLDRIITRLHLRPKSWKSETQLNQKQVNRTWHGTHSQPLTKESKNKQISKSSDWTDVDLEVPEVEEHIHHRNAKLALIFDNKEGTPTPPPRKHKKGIREKIEAVAKSSLQALQSKKQVEEPICVKKVVNYKCPGCDEHVHHLQLHKHHPETKNKENAKHQILQKTPKDLKRRKNLSVVSLPNYNELKLTVATFIDIDNKSENNSVKSCNLSLQGEKNGSNTKNYMIRCRSFGSLFPQQILGRLRTHPKKVIDIESDDSFGPLEDWDLKIIEHYSPRDTSLPRPRKVIKTERELLNELDGMIIVEKDPKQARKPNPPVRKSESLLKKINKEANLLASKVTSAYKNNNSGQSSNQSNTPPILPEKNTTLVGGSNTSDSVEDGKIEHSSLMKILEEFSIKDKQKLSDDKDYVVDVESSQTPDINAKSNKHMLRQFIAAEKRSTDDTSDPTLLGRVGLKT